VLTAEVSGLFCITVGACSGVVFWGRLLGASFKGFPDNSGLRNGISFASFSLEGIRPVSVGLLGSKRLDSRAGDGTNKVRSRRHQRKPVAPAATALKRNSGREHGEHLFCPVLAGHFHGLGFGFVSSTEVVVIPGFASVAATESGFAFAAMRSLSRSF
jgi:hypothetical protein